MAVTFDVASDHVGSGTSGSVPHTISGADRLLLVSVYNYTGSSAPEVPTVTYGGVPMDLVISILFGASTDERVSLFSMVAPPVGTADVVMSAAASQAEIVLGNTSYVGVDQDISIGAPVTFNTQSVVTVSSVVASAVDDLVADFIVVYNRVMTVGAGQSERINLDLGSAIDSLAASDEPGAPSVTMSWTLASSGNPGQIAVNIFAAGAGTQNLNIYDGASFIPAVPKIWDGGAWVEGVMKVWDGAQWQP